MQAQPHPISFAEIDESAPENYLRWFFDSNVWKRMSYRGVRTLKFPPDMWNYQEILFEHNIEWVVETGTRHGGSAIYFADLLRAKGSAGKVITVDPQPELPPLFFQQENIILLKEDSGTEATAKKVADLLPENRGPVFMILDSDHRAQHVLKELIVLTPLLRKGDYLLVEDTVVNGNPVRPDFGPGPAEAIHEFLPQAKITLKRDETREKKFGDSFARGGYFIVG